MKLSLRLASFFNQRQQQYSSLRRKWTYITATFIFVLFASFSFLLYKSCLALLMQEQEQTLVLVVDQLATRLEQASLPLKSEELNNWFSNDDVQSSFCLKNILPKNVLIEIYSPDGEMLTKVGAGHIPYQQKTKQTTAIESYQGKDQLVIRQPLFAKEMDSPIGSLQFAYNLSGLHAVRTRLVLLLGVFNLLLLLLSIILGYWLATYFLRPLKTLTATMQALKQEPQSDVRMPQLHSRDELSEIAAIFNEMLDRMQRYIEQQKQFVEDVSHELRTPVAIIEGHLQLLNRWGKDDPAILEESLQASLQEITRMKSLVQEMLDLSRAEQVEIHYSQERTKAKEVVYQTYNNFCLLYSEFVFTLDDDLPSEVELAIYRNHFEQILIILLDNAVKYSTNRPEVHISLSSTLNELEIAIQDFGEGITAIDLEKIFNRFYRVDKARSRDKGGNGLGLSIARQLLESYHGTITAESIIGYGSVFRITLPIVKVLE